MTPRQNIPQFFFYTNYSAWKDMLFMNGSLRISLKKIKIRETDIKQTFARFKNQDLAANQSSLTLLTILLYLPPNRLRNRERLM